MKSFFHNKKRIVSFVLSIVLTLSLFGSIGGIDSYAATGTATWDDINKTEVYMRQNASGYCTFYSNMMMVRRDQIIKGNSNWASITPEYCKPIMWTNNGMTWKYGIYDTEVRYSTGAEKKMLENLSAAEKCEFFKETLKNHPEGIVIYEITSNAKYNGKHAVLLTDYTDGMFYVADPARSKQIGRIPITESLVDITEVDSYWIVQNPGTLKNNYCVVGSDGKNTERTNPGYPYPIPTGSVRHGAVGEYAKWLQQALNTLIGSDISVSGVAGDKTIYYLKKFQYMYGIPEDGICGTDTRTMLINAILGTAKPVKSGSSYPAYGSTDEPTTDAENPGYPYDVPTISVRNTSSGDDVYWVQNALNNTISAGLTPNGIYNDETIYYVKKFQYMYGISQDGVVGPTTRAYLISVYKGEKKPVNEGSTYPAYQETGEEPSIDTSNPGAPFSVPTVSVKSTSSGDNVKWVQTTLNNLIGSNLNIDGVFSSMTAYYVKKFQYMYGLSQDGSVGPATRSMMLTVYKENTAPVNEGSTYPAYETDTPGTDTPATEEPTVDLTNPGAPYAVPSVTVKNTSPDGDNVRWVQTALNNVIGAGLSVNGMFTDFTVYMVKKFQYMYGITQDGSVGPTTRAKLISVYQNGTLPTKSGSSYPPFGAGTYIKAVCQMPYTGEGGGYLVGVETKSNPNQSYQYELSVLDCNLYLQGKDAWIYTSGKCGVAEGNAFWAVWQPQYGYYWTLFRVYDSNGKLLEEVCYGFANI